MIWNLPEHRAFDSKSEMDEVQEFAERNLQGFDVQVVAEHVWFYNSSRSTAVQSAYS